MTNIPYKAIIWDIDDVLVDTLTMYRISRTRTLEHLGFKPEEIDGAIAVWNRLFWYFDPGDKIGILHALTRELHHPASDSDITAAEALYKEIWTNEIVAVPGMPELLRELQSQNVPQAIASNGRLDWQLHKLTNAGMADLFGAKHIVVTENGTPQAKPNPYGVLKACEILGVEPSDAIYIGDRVTDTIAGNLAGATSIFFNRQPRAPEVKWAPEQGAISLEKPNHAVNNADELRALLLPDKQ